MKFEYDGDSEHRECVAYIDGDGDVIVRDTLNHTGEHPALISDGNVGTAEWQPHTATRRFYPGDKLTITF